MKDHSIMLDAFKQQSEAEKLVWFQRLLEEVDAYSSLVDALRSERAKQTKITYAPEWIEKILSGQKTMTIRRTQYPCGMYDVVSEAEPDRVVCRIEVVKVEKWDTEYWLSEMEQYDDYNRIEVVDDFDEVIYNYEVFPCFVKSSGFASIADFIQYHRENYAPVKFAHTFELVKGDNHVS